jgi:cytoskeletal protein RodZ
VKIEVGRAPESSGKDIGTWLRGKREHSGLTLRQIADTTKLSVHTFESLERNRVDQLPGGIYRRAIVRAYASEIGLDPEETLRAFLAQYPQEENTLPPEKVVVAAPAQPRFFRTVVGLIGTLIPVFAGVFYFTLAPADRVHRKR